MENFKIISRSENDTAKLAQELASKLPRGTVIALYGDLGAGKTVFSRAFAKAIGVKETVSSPTYTIIQEYLLDDGGYFYHLDLYRIKNSRDALAFAVDEYLNDGNAYALVEWPERIEDILGADTLIININHLSDTEREISVGK
ncbi:MAG: tRNA (adenosine(37)-N6)-threonylcarbamoyltransferase complex ATPase subunit type 1 TsaE [Lentisphaeria bacterium]|nr:tRNA (adenosine(37)-N6)-threonylcarbamoyltransferase complex ATPase subunit type 1 TsaE [Lentisphaeria bacterium]